MALALQECEKYYCGALSKNAAFESEKLAWLWILSHGPAYQLVMHIMYR